jgi:hypothetical protein
MRKVSLVTFYDRPQEIQKIHFFYRSRSQAR